MRFRYAAPLYSGPTHLRRRVHRALQHEQPGNQIALRDAINQHGIKKIFTFHSRVASTESFVSQGDEGIGSHLEGFACESVNGEMSAKVRNSILKDFKAADQAMFI